MKPATTSCIVLLITAMLWPAPTLAQVPVGTAFTYQGRLTDGGSPADGDYDMVFDLYDAATLGTLLGTDSHLAVPVTDGLFTVELEFGPAAFSGSERWLEIAVKGSSDPGFTTLSPRQPIKPTPHAIHALSTPGVFNIMSFGATPNDATDDTAAIEAARDAAVAAGGGIVLVPPGEYLCCNVLIKDGVSFVGVGDNVSILVNSGQTTDDHTLTSETGIKIYHANIRDLGFRFLPGVPQGFAMKFCGLINSTIEDFFIEAQPNRLESGGLYLWGDPALDAKGCFSNTIARGKIYMNQVGIRLEGKTLQGINQNFFRDITTTSRASNFIEISDNANVNLFEGIDCENLASGEPINQTYSFSLIDIRNASQNVIRGGYFDLGGYGKAVIHITGDDDGGAHPVVADGNIIEANNINHSGNYGIYIGVNTRKNIVRHNTFSNHAVTDVRVEGVADPPHEIPLYNEVYDNRFLDGEVGHISAPADTNTLQMWYSEDNDHLELRPRVWAERLTIGTNLYLNGSTMWSGTESDTGAKLLWGTGDPEGAVFGKIGSLYLRRDGGAGTTLYVKESGENSQSGWVAK